MSALREKERLALAEEVIELEERFRIVKEQTHCEHKNLHEKYEGLEKSALELDKQEVKKFDNISQYVKHLEDLMTDFPERLDLNDNLLEDMTAKMTAAEKRVRKGKACSYDKKMCKKELRNHLAKIRKDFPEASCFIRGEDLYLNGKIFYFSTQQQKLVRRTRSPQRRKVQDAVIM